MWRLFYITVVDFLTGPQAAASARSLTCPHIHWHCSQNVSHCLSVLASLFSLHTVLFPGCLFRSSLFGLLLTLLHHNSHLALPSGPLQQRVARKLQKEGNVGCILFLNLCFMSPKPNHTRQQSLWFVCVWFLLPRERDLTGRNPLIAAYAHSLFPLSQWCIFILSLIPPITHLPSSKRA